MPESKVSLDRSIPTLPERTSNHPDTVSSDSRSALASSHGPSDSSLQHAVISELIIARIIVLHMRHDECRCKMHRYTVCHTAIAATMVPRCDQLTSAIQHNGDDVVMLLMRADQSVVDTFGTFGPDPGSSWTVCGLTTATVSSLQRSDPIMFLNNATNIDRDNAHCDILTLTLP
jgi:hypothetical protein